MTILVKKVFISSKPTFVYLLCPPLCGPFSIQESAAGGLSYKGIKRDITPVKNAISLSVSSGFVEGNNNKFKVLKRIVYGRSGLVNLEKKCKLAFLPKNQDFSLSSLL